MGSGAIVFAPDSSDIFVAAFNVSYKFVVTLAVRFAKSYDVAQSSAKGVKYDNQPMTAPFQGWCNFDYCPRGDAFRFASRLPLAFIFRAVGA